jgi:hypothetical protein
MNQEEIWNMTAEERKYEYRGDMEYERQKGEEGLC